MQENWAKKLGSNSTNEVLHFSFLLNYELYCKQNLPSKALWNVPEYPQQSGSGDPGAPPCPKCNKRTGRCPWNPVLKNLLRGRHSASGTDFF